MTGGWMRSPGAQFAARGLVAIGAVLGLAVVAAVGWTRNVQPSP